MHINHFPLMEATLHLPTLSDLLAQLKQQMKEKKNKNIINIYTTKRKKKRKGLISSRLDLISKTRNLLNKSRKK